VTDMEQIADRLKAVQDRLHEACAQADRDPADVGLVAVSKTHAPQAIRRALACGQVDFGENYAQELRDKAGALTDAELRWHYIGRLQSNKAKYIAPHAHRVHALEAVRHAQALVKRADGRTLRCLVSVHTGDEASKGGVEPDQVLDRCAELDAIDGIEIVGLMTLPPYLDDPEAVAPHFEQLARLAEDGRAQGLALNELSMGMSHDFHVAIRYGATWIRVGTAIFGERGDGPWRA